MAGGPIFPFSVAYPSSGRVYPGYNIGVTNSRPLQGHLCEASLGADAVVTLVFEAPQSLPAGTPYLRAIAAANATSGNGVVNPAWASIAIEEDYDGASLTAEGNSTITWSTGDPDDLKEALIQLDADTVVADEYIVMEVTFVSASWTLAAISTWLFSIVWQ